MRGRNWRASDHGAVNRLYKTWPTVVEEKAAALWIPTAASARSFVFTMAHELVEPRPPMSF